MTEEGKQEINGLLFPEELDVPEGAWYRGESQDGDEFHIFGKEGHFAVAHQAGMESLLVEAVAHGARMFDDGETIPWAAAKATVDMGDGEVFEAIGSTDMTANSLEDMFSTAETKATKRAIKRALDIRSASEDSSGGTVREGPDGEVEVEPPDDFQPTGPKTDIGSGDTEW